MEKDSAEVRGRSYRKASERRAKILSSAIELFAERGVEASLRAIGDAIGVAQGLQHPLTRSFVQERFRQIRARLAERIRTGQRAGAIAADIEHDAAALVIAAS